MKTKTAIPLPLRRELDALFRALDERITSLGVGCWLRGRCCDFERCEHRLYASSLEIAYLLDKHGTAPLDGRAVESKLCPFWHEGRCLERERRPLGCRTYFCDRRYRDALEALYEEFHRRLAALALRYEFDWNYVPFVHALRTATIDGKG